VQATKGGARETEGAGGASVRRAAAAAVSPSHLRVERHGVDFVRHGLGGRGTARRARGGRRSRHEAVARREERDLVELGRGARAARGAATRRNRGQARQQGRRADRWPARGARLDARLLREHADDARSRPRAALGDRKGAVSGKGAEETDVRLLFFARSLSNAGGKGAWLGDTRRGSGECVGLGAIDRARVSESWIECARELAGRGARGGGGRGGGGGGRPRRGGPRAATGGAAEARGRRRRRTAAAAAAPQQQPREPPRAPPHHPTPTPPARSPREPTPSTVRRRWSMSVIITSAIEREKRGVAFFFPSRACGAGRGRRPAPPKKEEKKRRRKTNVIFPPSKKAQSTRSVVSGKPASTLCRSTSSFIARM